MIDQALAKLDAEIAAQEKLLQGLKWARTLLAGSGPAPVDRGAEVNGSDAMLAIKDTLAFDGALAKSSGRKSAKPKRRKAKAGAEEPMVFEINDVNVEMSATQFEICQRLIEAEGEWVKTALLLPISDGRLWVMKRLIGKLKELLKPAKARIDGSPHGYRLVSLDDGE